MIRTIVVDDEKLVRKGFISLIDWQSYGMTIVGEAGHARGALELLSQLEVDLLITDITMPGMSGFELIAELRRQYPHVWTVVLTCHHEFDYVQEALRLGAIDYIVKTLIEMDSIDEVMNRIVERIRTEERIRQSIAWNAGESASAAAPVQEALAFVPAEDSPAGQKEALRHAFGELQEAGEADRPVWLIPLRQQRGGGDVGEKLRKLHLSGGGGRALHLTGLAPDSLSAMRDKLAGQIRAWLFYEWKPGSAYAGVSATELDAVSQAQPDESWGMRAQAALELRWALYRDEWESFVAHIEAVRPGERDIRLLARGIVTEWKEWFHWHTEAPHLLAEASRIASWAEWKRWFREMAHEVMRRSNELELSREVMSSLLKAMLYMTSRLGDGDRLSQESVALHVNMSRSYFSQCFKRFAGDSFGHVLRDLRLRKAEELLLGTDDPVYEIAARVGFEDDKYFSKMFRAKNGLLPTEFRVSKARGTNLV